jgi:hypothetical protein
VRIFTRYILREVTGYALLGGVLFTFILYTRDLLPLMELFVRGVASPADVVHLILLVLPTFLTLTIPMAVLIGILLGLSRLAADSEITAMRASGVGILTFVRIVSHLCGAGLDRGPRQTPCSWRRAPLRPSSPSKSSPRLARLTVARPAARLLSRDFNHEVLYAQDVIPGANGTALWKHVFIADLAKPATPHIITADEASVISGGPQDPPPRTSLTAAEHEISLSDPDQYDISTFLSLRSAH